MVKNPYNLPPQYHFDLTPNKLVQEQIDCTIRTIWITIQIGYQFNVATRGYWKLAMRGQIALAQGGHYEWIFWV